MSFSRTSRPCGSLRVQIRFPFRVNCKGPAFSALRTKELRWARSQQHWRSAGAPLSVAGPPDAASPVADSQLLRDYRQPRGPSSTISVVQRAPTPADVHLSSQHRARAGVCSARMPRRRREPRRVPGASARNRCNSCLTTTDITDQQLAVHERMTAHFVAAQQAVQLSRIGSSIREETDPDGRVDQNDHAERLANGRSRRRGVS